MRRFVGYTLAVVALVLGAVAVAFVVGAGGYDADAVRAGGFVYLAVAAVLGLGAVLILRSRS